MTDTMSTTVTDHSAPIGGGQITSSAAPGAAGPGGQMQVGKAVLWTIGTAAAALLGLGLVFRKGGGPLPPLRIDAINALNIYFSWLLVNGTVKVLAYRYHGHAWSQAYLLVA